MPHKKLPGILILIILIVAVITIQSTPLIASSPADLIRQGRDTTNPETQPSSPGGENTQNQPSSPQQAPSSQTTAPPIPRNGIQLPPLNELIIEIVIAGFAIYTLIIGKDKGGREWWRAYPRLVILGILAKFIQVYLFVPGVTTMQQTASVVVQNILPAPALIAPVLTNIVRGSGNALENILVLLLSNIYIILIALFFLFRTGMIGDPEARKQRRSERDARRQNRQPQGPQQQNAQTVPDLEEEQPAAAPHRQPKQSEASDDQRTDHSEEQYRTKKAETILKNLLQHNEEILNDLRIVTQQYKVNKDPEELKINLEIIKRKMLRQNYITEEDIGHLYKLFNHLFHQKLYRV